MAKGKVWAQVAGDRFRLDGLTRGGGELDLRRLREAVASHGRLTELQGLDFEGLKLAVVSLEGLRLPGALSFRDCRLTNRLLLDAIQVDRLELRQCDLAGGLSLEEARVAGLCDLGHSTYGAEDAADDDQSSGARALVNLRRIQVGGRLSLTAASLHSRGRMALRADEARVNRNLQLNDGFFASGALNLKRIHIGGSLDCRGATLGDRKQLERDFDALNAEFAHVEGDVLLNSVTRLDGSSSTTAGQTEPGEHEKKRTEQRFEAFGGVDLSRATIRGSLEGIGGSFLARPRSKALILDDAHVDGHLLLTAYRSNKDPGSSMLCNRSDGDEEWQQPFLVWGGIRMRRAVIGHRLEFCGGRLLASSPSPSEAWEPVPRPDRCARETSARGVAVDAEQVAIGGGVEITVGAEADEEGLGIFGRLVFDWATVSSSCNFRGASIRGEAIESTAGEAETLPPRSEAAVSLKDATVTGDVLLGDDDAAKRHFECRGLVDLSRSDISGKVDGRNIRVRRGRSTPEEDRDGRKTPPLALRLDDTRVAVYAGFDGARLTAPSTAAKPGEPQVSVWMRGAHVDGPLWLRIEPTDGARPSLDLCSTQVTGPIMHAEESWPPAGSFRIHGLTYRHLEIDEADGTPRKRWRDRIVGWLKREPTSMNRWGRWLDRQWEEEPGLPWWRRWFGPRWRLEKGEDFQSQPHQQMIAVLRRTGQIEDAREVAIDLQRRRMWRRPLYQRIVPQSLLELIGYGYRPTRVLPWILILWLVGAFVFGVIHEIPSAETSTDDKPRPAFIALAYSLDTFLPIIDLHQEDHWEPLGPRVEFRWTSWFWWRDFLPQLYLWLHITAGWVLTTIAVAGFTGIVRKE